MKSVRTSVQTPSSVRARAMQAPRSTPSLMQPIFWATCWEAVLSAAVRSSTRSNFWSPKSHCAVASAASDAYPSPRAQGATM